MGLCQKGPMTEFQEAIDNIYRCVSIRINASTEVLVIKSIYQLPQRNPEAGALGLRRKKT